MYLTSHRKNARNSDTQMCMNVRWILLYKNLRNLLAHIEMSINVKNHYWFSTNRTFLTSDTWKLHNVQFKFINGVELCDAFMFISIIILFFVDKKMCISTSECICVLLSTRTFSQRVWIFLWWYFVLSELREPCAGWSNKKTDLISLAVGSIFPRANTTG